MAIPTDNTTNELMNKNDNKYIVFSELKNENEKNIYRNIRKSAENQN